MSWIEGWPQQIRLRSAGLATATAALLMLGCSGGESQQEPEPAGSSTTAAATPDQDDVVAAITGGEGGSPAFDPAALEAVEGRALPDSAELTPDPESVLVDEDLATIDVVVEVAGQESSKYWAFLRRVDDEWVVYATMPLPKAPEEGQSPTSAGPSSTESKESPDG